MNKLDFYTLDVFTNTPFSGNPLAVFVDAGHLSDQQMQSIAREMNLSETVFIREKTAKNRWSIRIFMPNGEIPFAGHPTVGTALLLRSLGWLETWDKEEDLILDEIAGAVPVVFKGQEPEVMAIFQTPQLPVIDVEKSTLTQADMATMLGLSLADIVEQPFVASCGVPYQIIQLTSVKALSLARLNLSYWREKLENHVAPDLCLFAYSESEVDIQMRMFAPAAGIAEDPATGSAAAALVGGLALKHDLKKDTGWMISQGTEMGRPSRIGTHVRINESGIIAVEVFGGAVVISQGTLLRQPL